MISCHFLSVEIELNYSKKLIFISKKFAFPYLVKVNLVCVSYRIIELNNWLTLIYGDLSSFLVNRIIKKVRIFSSKAGPTRAIFIAFIEYSDLILKFTEIIFLSFELFLNV